MKMQKPEAILLNKRRNNVSLVNIKLLFLCAHLWGKWTIEDVTIHLYNSGDFYKNQKTNIDFWTIIMVKIGTN